MSFLSKFLGLDAGKATMEAAGENKGILSSLQRTGNRYIDTGEEKSAAALKSAINGFSPYTVAGGRAVSMYGNALGLNGDDGTEAARDAFQTGPGYEFAMDQGTQAALRGASAAGMLNSGNTLTALTEYGQGLANQEYGSWLDRLNGLTTTGLSASNSQAGAKAGLADLYQMGTGNRLGLASSVAQGKMGVNNQMAQGQEANSAAWGNFGGNIISGVSKLATGGLF